MRAAACQALSGPPRRGAAQEHRVGEQATNRARRCRLRRPPGRHHQAGRRPRRRLDCHRLAGVRRSAGGERQAPPARPGRRARAQLPAEPRRPDPPGRDQPGGRRGHPRSGEPVLHGRGPRHRAGPAGGRLHAPARQLRRGRRPRAQHPRDAARRRRRRHHLRADQRRPRGLPRGAGAAPAHRRRRPLAGQHPPRSGHRRQCRGHPGRRRAPAGDGPSRRGAARRPVAAQHRQGTRAGLPRRAARRRPDRCGPNWCTTGTSAKRAATTG